MTVPYSFASRTTAIPLSELDSNFNTAITLGNTAIQLGNTVTTLNNMTLANVTISSGTINVATGNVTVNNLSAGNTTISTSETLSYGTANGVAYLNGSKVLTTGSALVFDGTNLGIGTSSPSTRLEVASAGDTRIKVNNTANTVTAEFGAAATEVFLAAYNSKPFVTYVGGSERMRIDDSGRLLIHTSTAPSPGGVGTNALGAYSNANDGAWVVTIQSAGSTTNRGLGIQYSAATPNDAFNEAIYFTDSTAMRFKLQSDGGIANYSANNSNLSDERTKTDIQDAGSYLSKICSIPVRTFKYKDQTDDLLNLGVIAQEVEAVAPELVDVSGFGETPEDGVPLKAIYQTDLQYALMKCIQELKAELDATKAEVAALKGA